MKQYYKLIMLLMWMIVIFLLSNEEASTSSSRSNEIVHLITTSFYLGLPEEFLTFLTRKTAHIIAYFILGILAFNVFHIRISSIKRTIIVSAAFTLAYAISDEIHQLFVPGRSGEIRDVLIDTTAGIIGIVICYFMYKILSNSKNSNNKV
jgi:VanZ family protein